MKKILHLIYVALLIIALYLAWLTVPYVRETVSCFDRKINDFDEVEFMTRSRGYAPVARCKLRQDKIFDLESCLKKTDEGTSVPKEIRKFVYQVIPLIRPSSGELRVIQDAHDEECADFPSTMFHPPESE